MDTPLNITAVEKIVGQPVSMFTFSEIDKFGDIEELFMRSDKIMIIYRSKPYFGHWCCIKKMDGQLWYFNPSGSFIDDARKYLGDFAKISNQSEPHLLKLLANQNTYDVNYMDFKLQSDNTNTCGRWCALFLKLPLTDVEFIKVFKYYSDKDIIKLTQ